MITILRRQESGRARWVVVQVPLGILQVGILDDKVRYVHSQTQKQANVIVLPVAPLFLWQQRILLLYLGTVPHIARICAFN